MRISIGRRTGTALVAVAGMAGLALGVAAPADAAVSTRLPVVTVSDNVDGLHVPARLHAGRVTLHFTSNVPDGVSPTLFRLRGDATLRQFVHYYAQATGNVSASQAQTVDAMRWLTRFTTFFGGADVDSRTRADVTETLYAGTYYVVDSASSSYNHGIKKIVVFGSATLRPWPRTSTRVVMSGERFLAPSTLPRNGTIVVRNGSSQVHFMELLSVTPSTTDASLQAQFEKILAGQNPGPLPFTGLGVGEEAISPGVQVVFHYTLRPGKYVMICFVPDDEDGTPHAFMGMHKVITVR